MQPGSGETKTVRVTICNQTFTLGTTGDPADLEAAANAVDERMRAIASRAGNIDTSRVAVLAGDFWSAKKGRDALSVDWDESAAFKLGTGEIMAEYRRLAATPGQPARKEGDAAAALASAAKTFEAAYEFPYLAHAAMEPMNCVVKLSADGCEIWNGEQFQSIDQPAVAAALGMKPEQVKLNMLYAGGSFGRRANPHADYVLEAAQIAKAIGGRVPVKLVWTREDDMRAGYYRPMYFHALKAGLDAQGTYVVFGHVASGLPILQNIEQNLYAPCPSTDQSCLGGAPSKLVLIKSITITQS